MSIINEALKKVQLGLKREPVEKIEHISSDGAVLAVKRDDPQPVAQPAAEPVTPPQQNVKKKSPTAMLLFTLVMLMAASYYTYPPNKNNLDAKTLFSKLKLSDLKHNIEQLTQVSLDKIMKLIQKPVPSAPTALAVPTPAPEPMQAVASTPTPATASQPMVEAEPEPMDEPPTPVAPIQLDVQGIMINAGANVALINNTIYEEGSEVNGMTIVKITTNAITILRDGKEENIAVHH